MAIVKPGDEIFSEFNIQSPDEASATNADVAPSAVLVRSGSDTGESVSMQNKDTGLYRFGFTIPSTYDEGDYVSIRVSASVGGSLGRATVWESILNASTVNDDPGTAGAGASQFPVVVNDEDGNPISDVAVWVSSDQAGTNVVAGTLHTDETGGASFMLDSGDLYLWREKSGFQFDNPVSFSID